MTDSRIPGIFCLEGPWAAQLTERSSVEPLLDLLSRTNGIRYLYDRVHTKEELFHLVNKWPQRQYDGYRIGYFAFHGSPGTIQLARDRVTLEELGEVLTNRLRGKFVHFGSCEVFETSPERLEHFRSQTGARAITGYRTAIDWMRSAALDLLYFDAFAYKSQADAIERDVRAQAGGLVDRLGFDMVRRGSHHADTS